MSDLPKRLRIKASMIALGERIPWGSDTALMEEAADMIEALSASVENHQLHMLGMARERDQLRALLAAAPAHPADRQEQGEVQRLREALDHIGGLSRALRVGGPDPMDLEGLSNALEEAVDTAHAALAASTGQEVEK